MTGYHYTPLENWEKIQEEGLVPQRVTSNEIYRSINAWLPGNIPPIFATYTWKKPQMGLIQAGHVLMVSGRHNRSGEIIGIKYDYEEEDAYQPPGITNGRKVDFFHNGDITVNQLSFPYHTSEPFVLVTRRIPPEEITQVVTLEREQAKRTVGFHFGITWPADF